MPGRPLVLASRSPQRRAILGQLGVPFEVEVPEVEEIAEGEPRRLVADNALRKARAIAAGPAGAGRRVLGADTAVAVDGRPYGKPRDEREARSFLEALSGREHEVWGGIALLEPGGGERSAVAVTSVRFRPLEPPQVAWYLDSEEWRERAGGYAIQGRGAALVERIEGDYWNVVGLPVYELVRLVPELFRA